MTFGTVMATFPIGGRRAFLDFDGQYFWAAYYGAPLFDHVQMFSRNWILLNTWDLTPVLAGSCLTGIYVGSYRSGGPFIYILAEDPSKIMLFDRQFTLLRQWALTEQFCDGIIVRGSFIHINNWSDGVHEIYDRNVNLITSWPIALEDYEDLAFDGQNIYIMEGWIQQEIGVFTLNGTLLSRTDLGMQTWGVTFDGQYLWVTRHDDAQVHMISRV